MEQAYSDIGGKFAGRIIEGDYAAAREFLAPWLHDSISEKELQSIIQNATQELPPPGAFSLDGNSCTFDELEVDEYSPPTKPLAPQITAENFRKWMVIEFQPDPELETGY
ncbi:MAG TPA: hypothetical protein VKH63_06735 [Candidatus Acidoferrum sp.]|nr:hypothetical protein [Candidatus Acidoferrum sp.]